MHALLTHNGVAWALPVREWYTGQKGIVADGRQYSRSIWRKNAAYLAKLGLFPLHEILFDQTTLRSSGHTETFDGSSVIWTHTTQLANIEVLKRLRAAEAVSKRSSVMYGGIIFNSKNFSTGADIVDILGLIGAALQDGETLPVGFTWTDMAGDEISLNNANFKLFRNAIAKHFAEAYKAAANHVAAIAALSTQQEVMDYDGTTNWPANPDLEQE
jgi:hypothetical protein